MAEAPRRMWLEMLCWTCWCLRGQEAQAGLCRISPRGEGGGLLSRKKDHLALPAGHCEVSPSGMLSPSFCQMTIGWGMPEASQGSNTSSDATTGTTLGRGFTTGEAAGTEDRGPSNQDLYQRRGDSQRTGALKTHDSNKAAGSLLSPKDSKLGISLS